MQKSCIAVMRRSCTIAQHREITLSFYIIAAGSQRPGEIMASIFLRFLFFVVVACLFE